MTDDNGEKRLTYESAGVDIERGADVVSRIASHVARTSRPGVLGAFGSFGGMFALDTERYPEPVLVSGADGVGTKLRLAFELGGHAAVGTDCVAMCVNDIVVQGAEPLYFLDYIASGRIDGEVVEQLVKGMADACAAAGCALLGGETAEMPGSYPEGEYDVAGFAVGVVNRPAIIDGSRVTAGDAIIGLGSSGVHSNGFSLVRHVLAHGGHELADTPAELGGRTLGQALLEPTRLYVATVLALLKQGFDLRAMAHITGGGLTENVPRTLPPGLNARLRVGSWEAPPIFGLLQEWGNLATDEMRRTFNMGLGFTLVVPAEQATAVLAAATALGERAFLVGEVVAGAGPSEVLFE